jgi:methylmalonyl-CoA mutase cobalamin-binding domain/chain
MDTLPYKSKHKIRIVTAAALFDGHDAAINIMRRIIQSSGVEVIHLGHDRSAQEVVNCAIQEDANAIAVTSYQGGHVEYFKYMFDLLKERGCGHIKIFGGGGGTILPSEIEDLHNYGIARIYHPDDGRTLGLQGMINDVLKQSDYDFSFETSWHNAKQIFHWKNSLRMMKESGIEYDVVMMTRPDNYIHCAFNSEDFFTMNEEKTLHGPLAIHVSGPDKQYFVLDYFFVTIHL